MKGKGFRHFFILREYSFLTKNSKFTNFIIGGLLAGPHQSPLIQCCYFTGYSPKIIIVRDLSTYWSSRNYQVLFRLFIHFGPIQSILVQSSPFCHLSPMQSNLVPFGPFYPLRSYLLNSFLFGPIRSTLFLFGPFHPILSIWSTLFDLVQFNPFRSL